MKKLNFFLIACFITISSFGQLSINEVSYYTSPQFIEINGPTSFILTSSGWQLQFYKGNGQYITTENLTGTLPATSVFPGENKSLLAFDTSSISYSSPPGGYVVLLNPLGTAVEFLAFQGSVPRILDGLTSTDIGSASAGQSLQKTDTGWASATPTKGLPTASQTTLPVSKNEIEDFALYPNPVTNGELYLTSRDRMEKQVEIYALTGQQVYNKKVVSKETMNISNLNNGIYMVRIIEDGKIATRKLIVN